MYFVSCRESFLTAGACSSGTPLALVGRTDSEVNVTVYLKFPLLLFEERAKTVKNSWERIYLINNRAEDTW